MKRKTSLYATDMRHDIDTFEGSGNIWKLHDTATGETEVNLPSAFTELQISLSAVNGGYTRNYDYHLIRDELDEIMNESKYYNIGFHTSGSSSPNGFFSSINCGKDKIKMNAFIDNNIDLLSVATMKVYYR